MLNSSSPNGSDASLGTATPDSALPAAPQSEASAASAASDSQLGATTRRRRGRRPAGADTRAQILGSARRLFSGKGYSKVSLRAIARDADVDPALVHHYFHGKPALFFATISDTGANPVERLSGLALTPRELLARELVFVFLDFWDDAEARRSLENNLDATLSPSESLRPVREFVTTEVLTRIPVGGESAKERALRAQLVASQLIGMGLVRYVLQQEPFAKATPEQIADWIAPTLQRYLDGEIA